MPVSLTSGYRSMGGYKNILFEVREGVAIVTLNNPESRNPLTEETKNEVISVLEEAVSRSEWRALVITAKGAAFCAGGLGLETPNTSANKGAPLLLRSTPALETAAKTVRRRPRT